MFVIALSTDSTDKLIRQEAGESKDILFLNFTDEYKKLPYKAILSMKFILENCSKVKNVIKVDDDVSDIRMKSVQRTVSKSKSSDFLYCKVHSVNKISRKVEGKVPKKWSVTEEEFPKRNPDTYPAFCQGMLIVMPLSTLEALYKQVPFEPFMWVDDIYVTGILREHLKPQPTFYRMELAKRISNDKI